MTKKESHSGQATDLRKQAEATLLDSKLKFQFLAESMADVVFTLDINLVTTYVSPSIERMLGFTPEERIAQKVDQQLTPKSQKLVFETLLEELGRDKEKGVDLDRSMNMELEYYHKNGSIRYLATYIRGIRDSEGNLTGFYGSHHDITELKRTVEALRESEGRYRLLAEHTKDIVWLMDMDTKPFYQSPSSEILRGYTIQELADLPPDKNFTPDSLKLAMEFLMSEMPKIEADHGYDPVHILELEYYRKDGTTVWLENKFSVIRDESGKPVSILGEGRDITERKQAEAALRESEERFRMLVENATDTIWTTDLNLRYTYVSPNIKQRLDYTSEEFMLLAVNEVLPPSSLELCMQVFAEELEIEKKEDKNLLRSRTIEIEEINKNGSIVPCEVKMTFMHNNAGQATGILGHTRDITERKQAEAALRESEGNYRNLFENATEAIFVIQDYKVVFQNPRAIMISGYSSEEIVPRQFIEFVHPDERDILVDRYIRIVRGEDLSSAYPFRLIQKNGGFLWFEGSSVLIDWKGKPATLNFLTDITARKQSEDELLLSQEQYRSLVENINDVIFRFDLQETFTYISPAIERISGYTASELEGLPFSNFVHPDDLSGLVEVFKKTVYGITGAYEFRVLDKTGEPLWVVTRSRLVTESDKPPYIAGTMTDITERKRAEEKLQDTLESLRKAVGTTIQVMVSAVETRDPYTAGHQVRSANLARTIATEMGLSQEKIEGIRMAGSIHDIGKLSIPAEILSKPTKLSELEFSLIKEHARQGYEMLKDVESPWPLAEIVYQHHERMDGSGYPRNLKGDDILMEARIMAVADVVEAMASHRPYRPALGIEAALEEIEKNRGTLYDEAVVDFCLRLFREKSYSMILQKSLTGWDAVNGYKFSHGNG